MKKQSGEEKESHQGHSIWGSESLFHWAQRVLLQLNCSVHRTFWYQNDTYVWRFAFNHHNSNNTDHQVEGMYREREEDIHRWRGNTRVVSQRASQNHCTCPNAVSQTQLALKCSRLTDNFSCNTLKHIRHGTRTIPDVITNKISNCCLWNSTNKSEASCSWKFSLQGFEDRLPGYLLRSFPPYRLLHRLLLCIFLLQAAWTERQTMPRIHIYMTV